MNKGLIKSVAIMLVVLIFLTSCGDKKSNTGKKPSKKPQQGISSSDNSGSDERNPYSDVDDGDGGDDNFGGYDHANDTDADSAADIDFSSYPIIYPAGLNETAHYSVNRLATRLNNKYAMIDVYDDASAPKSGQKELLIGNTNRAESKKAYNMLTANRSNNAADYIIMVNNGSVVINATSNYALEKATKYFYDELCKSEFAEIKENYVRFYKAPLIAGNGQIAGTDIREYKIVMPRDKSFIYSSEAERLTGRICEAVGIEIPIADDRSTEQKYEIIIGKTSRAASNIQIDTGKYTVRDVDGKIIVLGDSDISTAAAVNELFAQLIGKTEVKLSAGININKSYSKSGTGYYLAWSDEFNGSSIDKGKWIHHNEEATAYDGGILYRDDSEQNSYTIHSTIHRWWMMDAGNGHEQISSYIPSERFYTLKNGEIFNDSFHTIGCEWTEEYLAFYLDGIKYTEVDITSENMDVFHQPAFLIISMAVGLTGIEKPDENTPWPGLYEIDYCRVYQKPGVGSMNIR